MQAGGGCEGNKKKMMMRIIITRGVRLLAVVMVGQADKQTSRQASENKACCTSTRKKVSPLLLCSAHLNMHG